MPCHDYTVHDEYRLKKDREYQDKIDDLTRMLCNLLGSSGYGEGNEVHEMSGGRGYLETYVPKETMDWWKKHKALDELRKQEELEEVRTRRATRVKEARSRKDSERRRFTKRKKVK